MVSGDLPESSTYFCAKTPAEFGANFYRKASGVLLSGKSAAKHLRFLPGGASDLNASPLHLCQPITRGSTSNSMRSH